MSGQTNSPVPIRPLKALPPATPHVYSVPQRFGLTSIFALTTLMAILFGSLRRVDAPPPVYFCLGVTTLAICVVQMFYAQSPRIASALTGAIAFPLCLLVSVLIWGDRDGNPEALVCAICSSVFSGVIVGYLSGACLAGIFLLQDLVENYVSKRRELQVPNNNGKVDPMR